MQLVCVKWGKSVSQYFSKANGVRQGSILSPKLFALYMNGRSGALSLCKAGSLSARILHRAPPPPRLQVDQIFLTQKIVADLKMRCHQKSFGIWRVTEAILGQKTCFFSKNIFWKKIIINHTIFLNFRYAFFRY